MKELFNYLKKFDFINLLITPTKNSFIQFFRYIFVGGIATIIDMSVLYILTDFININYLISSIIAFIFGLITNFVLSKLFVFKSNKTNTNINIEFIIYSVIGIIGLSITEIIMFVFTNYINLHYMISKIISTIIVLFWNYILRKILIYKK